MKILITGATGKVGSRLGKRLTQRGDHVRALVRDPARAADLREAGIELIEGDLLRADSLAAAVHGVDAVVHCAAFFRGATPEQAHAVNDLGTQHLAKAARAASVRRFIFTSTGLVYGPNGGRPAGEDDRCAPVDGYPASKLAAERFLLAIELGVQGPSAIEIGRVQLVPHSGRAVWQWRARAHRDDGSEPVADRGVSSSVAGLNRRTEPLSAACHQMTDGSLHIGDADVPEPMGRSPSRSRPLVKRPDRQARRLSGRGTAKVESDDLRVKLPSGIRVRRSQVIATERVAGRRCDPRRGVVHGAALSLLPLSSERKVRRRSTNLGPPSTLRPRRSPCSQCQLRSGGESRLNLRSPRRLLLAARSRSSGVRLSDHRMSERSTSATSCTNSGSRA